MIAVKSVLLSAVLASTMVAAAQPKSPQPQSQAKPPAQLELFGVQLKSATREQLREVFEAGGLQPVRVEDKYWVDTYSAAGVLDGASGFIAGYVGRTGTFAFAQYEFEGFMDTGLVTQVATMVTHKYGRASTRSGNEGLGPVTYTWKFPQGMTVSVSRGWPDTTTYLTFTDPVAHAEMRAEQEADKRAAERERAKAQTRAF